MVAVLDMDGAHHPDLQRLHYLGAALRHDLALGRGQDVDAAHDRPSDGDGEKGAEAPDQGAAERRGRVLHDLDGGRQEFALAALEVALWPRGLGPPGLAPDRPVAGEAGEEA